MIEQCLNCKFFKKIDSKLGFCRRFPPESHYVGNNQMTSSFVTSKVGDYCGEYKPGLVIATEMPTTRKQ